MHTNDENRFGPLPAGSRLLRWLKHIVPKPPLSFRSHRSRQQLATFLHRVKNRREGAIILNIGSKSAQLAPTIYNLDIHPFPGVHTVGDAHRLPFHDRSIDGVCITAVLEHVSNPSIVIKEIKRVLKIGGEVYADVPFMQPFHPDPRDYQRYTLYGLEYLFSDFELIDKGICRGPSAALAWMLSEYMAILLCLGNRYLYTILARLFRFIFFPLPALDVLLEKNTYSQVSASSHFIVCKKAD